MRRLSATVGVRACSRRASKSVRSRPRWAAVRKTDASTCWVSAPRAVRLPPPDILRVTTAGRSACSARQLVASSVGSKRKLKMASYSTMRCALKTPHAEAATRGASQQPPEALEVLAAGRGEAVRRQRPGAVWRARTQRRLQDRLHRRDERVGRIVEQQDPALPQQIGETGLMGGVGELATRLPAIPHQDAGILGADHGGRLGEPAAGLNRVDGRFRRDEGPEPLQIGRHAPARFIGRHDRAAPHRRAQRVVGRLGLPRRAAHRVDQAARRDRQPEALPPQPRDLAIRQPEVFIEDHRQRDRLRSELHGGGAERVGRLQRMAALHPSMTRAAASDVHVEAAHERDAARGALPDNGWRCAHAESARRRRDTAAATRRRRCRRRAPGYADALSAHTRPRICGRARRGCATVYRAKTARPAETRPDGPRPAPLSVSRFLGAAADAPLPIGGDPPAIARGRDAAPR